MTGALVGILLLLVIALSVALIAIAAKARGGQFELGQSDHISDDVMGQLLEELAKHKAEASYWKDTAERLQRELDQRQ